MQCSVFRTFLSSVVESADVASIGAGVWFVHGFIPERMQIGVYVESMSHTFGQSGRVHI